jgi:hypothetical protein|tara:strand:- start:827 stop:1039 length:213 start_codon:yes stop_codon:yes gene_type:complete
MTDATPEQTITIGDTNYPISELTVKVKEMISLYQQASEMSQAAKRQSTIHDVAVHNLGLMIEKAVTESEE